ncbi:MAG: drug/metabolite exporter YedA [Anaerolineae bacterium]
MATRPAVVSSGQAPLRLFSIPLDRRFWVIASLAAVYIIWSTTYLVLRFALESFPPYWLMATRFVIAGGGLLIFLALRGVPMPTPRQWRNAAIIGALLLGGGMGSVAMAEQSISSGLAAALVATSPLLTMLFGLLWKRIPSRNEWFGVLFGLAGVVLLSLEGNLQANPIGILQCTFASMCWAFGSVLTKHLDFPEGVMGSAAEMVTGGVILCGLAIVSGETFPTAPTTGSLLSVLYLIIFGSLITMVSFGYLLKHVSPTLATSYSFVNPAFALLLGVLLGGEVLTGSALIALPVILVGIAFVFRDQRKSATGKTGDEPVIVPESA